MQGNLDIKKLTSNFVSFMGILMHNFFKNKKVFITGHTGFKGSWLAIMLESFGAKITGYALKPDETSHYNLVNLGSRIHSVFGNINDIDSLKNVIERAEPDIIFHLAAQPFVRRSYRNPIETWQTNVIGTLNLFEATKNLKSLRAIINITTDKCYENKEWCWAYRENDELGGHDPYSASKAAVEILSSSYRKSFLKARGIQMATVRAGNVIGGGDFGEDRLIPAIINAFQSQSKVVLRNPNAVRPWQHVLEALYGYLLIAEKLYNNEGYDIAYNFGPDAPQAMTVLDVVKNMQNIMPNLEYIIQTDDSSPHEAGLLMLDNSLAKYRLQWKPQLTTAEAINLTVKWYLEYLSGNKNMLEITRQQINSFLEVNTTRLN